MLLLPISRCPTSIARAHTSANALSVSVTVARATIACENTRFHSLRRVKFTQLTSACFNTLAEFTPAKRLGTCCAHCFHTIFVRLSRHLWANSKKNMKHLIKQLFFQIMFYCCSVWMPRKSQRCFPDKTSIITWHTKKIDFTNKIQFSVCRNMISQKYTFGIAWRTCFTFIRSQWWQLNNWLFNQKQKKKTLKFFKK